MTTPAVRQTVLDGQMGSLPATSGRIMAVVGCGPNGPVNTPITLARESDVQTIFGSGTPGSGPQGKLAEMACNAIRRSRRPVMVCRAQAVSPGTVGAITRSMAGTCVPVVVATGASAGTAAVTGVTGGASGASFLATGSPVFDGDMVVEFLANATAGGASDSVPYHYSVDGGDTWSQTLDLGDGLTLTVPENNWQLTLVTGSGAEVKAGERVLATASAPSPNPIDDFEVEVEITKILSPTGSSLLTGSVGVDSMFFRWSLDGGRTQTSFDCALGTGSTLTITDNYGSLANPSDAGDLTFTLDGTLAVGDKFTCLTHGPRWSLTTLNAALAPLAETSIDWESVQLAEAVDDAIDGTSAAGATIAALDAFVAGMSDSSAGAASYRHFVCSLRPRIRPETDAQYQVYAAAVRAQGTSTHGAVGAEAVKMPSVISGRVYRRGVADAAAAVMQGLSQEQSAANKRNVPGGLPGCSIVDANGNLDDHDEALQPGLDDLMYLTLRSWRGEAGAFVTQDRIYAPTGSDFILVPVRRVFNLFQAAIDAALIPELMAALPSDPKTGYLRESTLAGIEKSVLSAIDAVIFQKPMASGRSFVLSRTDDVRTRTFHATAKLVSLVYPEAFEIEVSLARTV